jgi:hypothetical protein
MANNPGRRHRDHHGNPRYRRQLTAVLATRDTCGAQHRGETLYRSEMRLGYAACEYSLISPLRTFLRRTRAVARLTAAGRVFVAWGGR